MIEVLQKALQYCDFDEENPKFPLYQYRAAMIHYRIGCLYHSHIWMSSESANRKSVIQLAKINYEKASKYYLAALDVISYFTSQMQRVALSEYLADSKLLKYSYLTLITQFLAANAPNVKIKHLQYCLDIFIEINSMIQLLIEKKADIPENEIDEENETKEGFKTCLSLLNLIRQRLQHVLKILVKLCLTKPPPSKDCPKLAEIYKACYMKALSLIDGLTCEELVNKLHEVLICIADKIQHSKCLI